MIEQKPNKIKGQHIRRQRDGKSYLYPKVYTWHIPHFLRSEIEIGDIVEVIGGDSWVQVIDLFFAEEPKNHQSIYRIVKKRKLDFADQLKKFRKKNKLTQAELGQLLGVSLTTITGWERNKSKPQKRLYPKIEEILNIELNAEL